MEVLWLCRHAIDEGGHIGTLFNFANCSFKGADKVPFKDAEKVSFKGAETVVYDSTGKLLKEQVISRELSPAEYSNSIMNFLEKRVGSDERNVERRSLVIEHMGTESTERISRIHSSISGWRIDLHEPMFFALHDDGFRGHSHKWNISEESEDILAFPSALGTANPEGVKGVKQARVAEFIFGFI